MAFIELTRIAGSKRMVVNTEYIIHLEKGTNGGTYISALGWTAGCDFEDEMDDIIRLLGEKDFANG
jgi:hypothetical protein